MQEQQFKTNSELARLTAFFVVGQFTEENIEPMDLGRFPWEKPRPLPQTDPELFNRRVKEFSKNKGK